jgi:hypothetical protein
MTELVPEALFRKAVQRTRPIGGIVRGSVRLDRRIIGSGSTAAETAAGMASAGRAAAEATIERPDSADIFRRLSVRQEGDSPDSDPACRLRTRSISAATSRPCLTSRS